MTITEFLEARIAEDEAVAQEAIRDEGGQWYTTEPDEDGDTDASVHGDIRIYNEGGHTYEQAVHIARHDPVRVLRECAAKRAIVERHRRDPVVQSMVYGDIYPCTECGDADDSPMAFPCPTVKALAYIYSDHPEYRQEWKP